MAALEDLKPNAAVRGVLPTSMVTVVSVDRQTRKTEIILRVEFGTGFLPPETGAPKAASETISPRRDRKSETTRARNGRKSPLRACRS